jgi:prepilin-type processing-associated H-X9-DG protein
LAKAKTKAQGIACINNLKQLILAWTMYADDNNGVLPPNHQYGYDLSNKKGSGWVDGWMDFSSSNTDNTNTVLLLESRLGPYSQSPGIYKCPADRSMVTIGGKAYPRARSVAMNTYIGGDGRWNNSAYREMHKMTEITEPPPAKQWVIIDEREDSINDAFFAVGMESPTRMVDWPAAYHNNAGGLSFADGHAEIRKWVDPRTRPVLKKGQALSYNVSMPNNPDVLWLQERTTSRR